VVLLPDKRGSGRSGGDWRTASFEDLADDAIAAVAALRALDGVDRDRVGLVGLSQGGHIAPLAARRSADVAFLVNISGSAVPIVEQVIDEVEKLAQRAGFTQEQVDRVNALHRKAADYALSGGGWEAYAESLERALESDLASHGVVEPFPRTPDHWVWAWARAVGPYDPLPHWRASTAPAVIAYGAQDTQIHVAESVDLLLGLPTPAGAPRTVLVFSDSGHGLREPSSHRIRRDLLDFLGSWVTLLGSGSERAVASHSSAVDRPAAPAAAEAPPPCSSAEHRRFDFWVGTWEVRGAARPEAAPGRNVISLEHGGCVLREEYANGRYSGTSLSFYDAGAGLWRQTWIDNQGQPLLLAGGWRDGALAMAGPEGAAVRDRITWTPNADGSVRQLWEKSADGGATWTVAFDGLYTRAGAAAR
jgi:acetyl esterase/lipase